MDLDTHPTDELSFDITVDEEEESVTVTLRGELDMSATGAVEAAVEPTLRDHSRRLVVDVHGLTFADSSALALWARWANIVDQVEIREPSELLRTVIQRMGLDETLHLTP
jgi:anti-anti-sigma factor